MHGSIIRRILSALIIASAPAQTSPAISAPTAQPETDANTTPNPANTPRRRQPKNTPRLIARSFATINHSRLPFAAPVIQPTPRPTPQRTQRLNLRRRPPSAKAFVHRHRSHNRPEELAPVAPLGHRILLLSRHTRANHCAHVSVHSSHSSKSPTNVGTQTLYRRRITPHLRLRRPRQRGTPLASQISLQTWSHRIHRCTRRRVRVFHQTRHRPMHN